MVEETRRELVVVGVGGAEIVFEDGAVRGRGFQRECRALLVDSRGEGVGSAIEHLLGEAAGVGRGLDAKVQ